VMAAVSCCGRELRHASERCKDEWPIVAAAVKNDGTALEFASQRLKDNREIVVAAVRRSIFALEFAGDPSRAALSVRQAVLEETLLEQLDRGLAARILGQGWRFCQTPEVIQMLPQGDARKWFIMNTLLRICDTLTFAALDSFLLAGCVPSTWTWHPLVLLFRAWVSCFHALLYPCFYFFYPDWHASTFTIDHLSFGMTCLFYVSVGLYVAFLGFLLHCGLQHLPASAKDRLYRLYRMAFDRCNRKRRRNKIPCRIRWLVRCSL